MYQEDGNGGSNGTRAENTSQDVCTEDLFVLGKRTTRDSNTLLENSGAATPPINSGAIVPVQNTAHMVDKFDHTENVHVGQDLTEHRRKMQIRRN